MRGAMSVRGNILAALAVAATLAALPAEAGSRKVVVTPVLVPPSHVDMMPIRAPLAGAFLVARPSYCRERLKCGTGYYFQGRFADRPDTFYIVRRK
jgi:hypothetical protein